MLLLLLPQLHTEQSVLSNTGQRIRTIAMVLRAPALRDSDLIGLGWWPGISIFKKFPR